MCQHINEDMVGKPIIIDTIVDYISNAFQNVQFEKVPT